MTLDGKPWGYWDAQPFTLSNGERAVRIVTRALDTGGVAISCSSGKPLLILLYPIEGSMRVKNGAKYDLRFVIDDRELHMQGTGSAEDGYQDIQIPTELIPEIVSAETRIEVFHKEVLIGSYYMLRFERTFGPERSTCGFSTKR